MVRQGGARPLAAALTRALRERREVVTSDVHIATNGKSVSADISVIPVTAPAVLRDLLLVTIAPSPRPAPVPGKPHPVLAPGDGASREELEQELRFTRESLSTTIEELQTANEELKSSNEELQSTNEELHSSNEELETSREEMQSLNEELNTVNTELQSKVEALTRVNDDMRNLLNGIQVATIFLDDQLRVKRYTEQARHLVRLIESDIGRPLSDLTSSLRYERLIEDCRRVLATLVPIEQEVQDMEGHWYLVRLLPYRRAHNVIAGLVMTVLDIDRTKQAELHAQAGLDYFQSIVHTAREPLLMLGEGLRVVEANDSFYRTFEVQPKQVEGRRIYELGNRQWDNPGLRELLERILPEQNVIADYRIEHDFPNIGRRVFALNARRRPPLAGGAALIIVAFEDVTPRAP